MRTRRIAPLAVAAVALLAVTGLASCTPGTTAVEAAREQIGQPYVYGGSQPGGFDCSGLTSYAWAQAGVEMPRTSSAQYSWTDQITRDDLRAGDLVFYSAGGPNGTVSHVSLYAGDDTLIHARNSSHPVREDNLSTYWTSNLVGYGRVPQSAMP
ncbi:hypothetical protein BH23ACT2_BH23ACT2_28460 [soil metagenome]